MKSIEEFNSGTKKSIEVYLKALFIIFPNLKNRTDYKSLESTLISNLDHNIEFNCELPKGVMGQYAHQKKKIKISKKVNTDSLKKDLVIIHELTHALTADIDNNEIVKKAPYICEILTTLIEKRFYKAITGENKKRINGYISDFGDQLEIVYQDRLLEQFIVDPTNMEEIFSIDEVNVNLNKFLFKDFCLGVQEIPEYIKMGKSDTEIKLLVENLESNVLLLLTYQLDFSNIKKTLKSLETLLRQQYYPNMDNYYGLIQKTRKFSSEDNIDRYLEKHKNLKKACEISSIEDKSELLSYYKNNELSEKEIKFVARKIFGFSDSNITPLEKFFDNERIYLSLLEMTSNQGYDIEELKKYSSRSVLEGDSIFGDNLKYNNKNSFLSLFENDLLTVIYNESDKVEFLLGKEGVVYKSVKLDDVAGRFKDPERIQKFYRILEQITKNGYDLTTFYISDDDLKGFCDSFDDFFISIFTVEEDMIKEIKIDNCDQELDITTNNFKMNEKISLYANSEIYDSIFKI